MKKRAFIEKVNGYIGYIAPEYGINVLPNKSETEGHKGLTLGQIVYKLVFYNISFSWLLPLDGFRVSFLLCDSANDLQSTLSKTDTFGTGTKCPSYRDVRFIESQIKEVKKGRDQL